MSEQLNCHIALACVSRVEQQDLTGKKRDDAIINFFCGAIAALELADKPTDAAHLTKITALLICTRGYSYVKEMAAKAGG